MSKKPQENKDLATIWAKLNQLEEKIQKTASEEQQLASNASRKASEYRNKTEETKKQADFILLELNKIKTEIEACKQTIDDTASKISEKSTQAKSDYESLQTELKEIEQKKSELVGLVNELNLFFDENTNIEEQVENLKNLITSSSDSNNKIAQILKNALNRKTELDDLYYEIIGYEEEDEETGETTQIEGKKDELENAYSELSDKLSLFKKQLTEHQTSSVNSYDQIKVEWEKKYGDLEKEIAALLPNALTAGLSHAYSHKKENEENSLLKLEANFTNSILGLVAVSLIPFAAAIAMLVKGDTFHQTILNLPRIILAILPLYIPVLWLAYSANRKMNLSKRLIEEYTHKEVLTKTFEGLSKQIKSIPNEEHSNELRIRLLYNLLNVSSENPGKLISDYNKTDHPIIDAIDKSSKLSEAVDRLEKIPGMKKVAKILEARSEKIINKQMDKVEEALDAVADGNLGGK